MTRLGVSHDARIRPYTLTMPTARAVIPRAQGRVISQLPHGRVRVQTQALGGCERCARGRGCGLGLQANAAVVIECDTDGVALSDGSLVDITPCNDDRHWLYVVGGAYGLPTLGLLCGAVLGATAAARMQDAATTGMHDMMTAGAGLLGLAGGVLAWRVLAERLPMSSGASPHASRARTVPLTAPAQ